jgi:DNA helicase-2/ATP-dependent DNA helicase PcrA
VPTQLVENLGGRSPAWSTPAYSYGAGSRGSFGRGASAVDEFNSRHYNYEDESQEAPRITGSAGAKMKNSGTSATPPESIDNIARFFGGKSGNGKPGHFGRPVMDIPQPTGAAGLQKGQRVRHAKYGEGTILVREGSGEDTKLTVMFNRHGMKKLVERFANLQKI